MPKNENGVQNKKEKKLPKADHIENNSIAIKSKPMREILNENRRDFKLMNTCVVILTIIGIGVVVQATQGIFMPFVLAWLLSYVFSPVITFLTNRLKLPNVIAVVIVISIVLAICVWGGAFVSARIRTFIDAYPFYEKRLFEIVRDISNQFELSKSIGSYEDFSVDWGGLVRPYLLGLSSSLVSLTSKAILMVIFLFFLLLSIPGRDEKIIRAAQFIDNGKFQDGETSVDLATKLINTRNTISKSVSKFLSVMFLISASTGFCIWLVLSYLKVDFAVTWGVLAFALNFIPTVGSIVASIPPILVAIVQFYPDTLTPLLVIAGILIIQNVIGNMITPQVMGDTLELSPVVILIALLFWGWLLGIVGALLAVPLTVIVKIICSEIGGRQLKAVAVMMGPGKARSKAKTK